MSHIYLQRRLQNEVLIDIAIDHGLASPDTADKIRTHFLQITRCCSAGVYRLILQEGEIDFVEYLCCYL